MKKKIKLWPFLAAPISALSLVSASCNVFSSTEASNQEVLADGLVKAFENKLQLNKVVDDYKLNSSDFLPLNLEDIEHENILSSETKQLINKLNQDPRNWLKLGKVEYSENNFAVTYTDPIFKIKWVDHVYRVRTERQADGSVKNVAYYALGFSGLILLANYFYALQPFGPEIVFLNLVNVNYPYAFTPNVAGLYLPAMQVINLDATTFTEKTFSLKQKVIGLHSTLYHEYTHHWSNSYVEIGDLQDKTVAANTTFEYNDLASATAQNVKVSKSYFYKDFFDKFKTYLHYDDSTGYDPTYIERANGKIARYGNFDVTNDNFIGNARVSTSDIFALANTTDFATYKEIYQRLDAIAETNADGEKEITFTPSDDLETEIDTFFGPAPVKVKSLIIGKAKLDSLKYYYSFEELIPREWQKYSYIPIYYDATDTNINWNNKEGSTYKPYQNFYVSGYVQPSPNNNGFEYLYTNNTFVTDWGRTYPLAATSEHTADPNTRIFANDVWIPVAADQEPTYRKFYRLFLETMGYGKVIAQLKSKADFKVANKTTIASGYTADYTPSIVSQLRFTGYLDGTDYSGFVFKEADNKKTTVKINYLPFVNFRGLQTPANTFAPHASLQTLLPSDVLSNGRDFEVKKVATYVTDYFDRSKIKTDAQIYLWKDTNNNQIAEDNELISELSDTYNSFTPTSPLPARPLTNSDRNLWITDESEYNYEFITRKTPNNTYTLWWKDNLIS
ncbi:MYPU_1760 family metalloprotease [Mycoplasmopsis columbinasalis]|uniref:Lipoprotein n=1 Tax=Mycoplasmopsis columbinasalis TaxID=114880 RepID=A0A449BAR2_9BACT|nr:hypothetical protein [Mycoplasmopsis columbinasalis]VEU78257.1 Uncharacterised protein [Mycoplasmopsis columbinasalis]